MELWPGCLLIWSNISSGPLLRFSHESNSEFCASGDFMMTVVDAQRRYKCRVYLGWGHLHPLGNCLPLLGWSKTYTLWNNKSKKHTCVVIFQNSPGGHAPQTSLVEACYACCVYFMHLRFWVQFLIIYSVAATALLYQPLNENVPPWSNFYNKPWSVFSYYMVVWAKQAL